MRTTSLTLDSGWRFCEAPDEAIPEHNRVPWLPAQVPGHVHLDLHRAGVIPDPFARMYERGVAWVDDRDWIYETTFSLQQLPARPRLSFRGLDTIAEIELNGKPVAMTDNMFVPHEFPVDGLLRAGEGGDAVNTLRITFRSAKRVGAERLAIWNQGPDAMATHWNNWSSRSFVRKAQYMFGWDWGPELISCGIWGPVALVSSPAARILDWRYTLAFPKPDQAELTIHVDIEIDGNNPGEAFFLTASLKDQDSAPVGRDQAIVRASKGCETASATIAIPNPRRWRPNGAGGEPGILYEMRLDLSEADGQLIDGRAARIGLRTIELLHESDADGNGEGFKIRVNGDDLFAKGANWIPNDSFPSAIDKVSLRSRVEQARDAGFNMLRVWGGGLYESEEFYELCDEFGILVWQDFPYACAYYPDTEDYAVAAGTEATAAVRRIRNHASLCLWCGNNENHAMHEGGWTGQPTPRFIGEHLYDKILPQVIAREDPATPYWPSSPYGGQSANSEDFGDCHNWEVWHGLGDWKHYDENDCRFVSEFGFASSCGVRAWNSVLDQPDRGARTPVVQWHDKTRKGYETYLSFVGVHFPEPKSLDDLVYYSQINAAEALKFGVEHYRRRIGRCWGTLFWQFNDCWPVQSWSIVDYLGDCKAGYYAAKRFYAPVLVSLTTTRDKLCTAHITNDSLEDARGTLELALKRFDGSVLAGVTTGAMARANHSANATQLDLSAATGIEREVYIAASFKSSDGTCAENFAFLAEPKELLLPPARIDTRFDVRPGEPDTLVVSSTAFAAYVWIQRSDGGALALADNFLHLEAGQTKRIACGRLPDLSAKMEASVIVRTLWDAK